MVGSIVLAFDLGTPPLPTAANQANVGMALRFAHLAVSSRMTE
jgi:hypothetical protein